MDCKKQLNIYSKELAIFTELKARPDDEKAVIHPIHELSVTTQ